MVFELKERKKKTRVVCTIGPASEDEKMLKKLILAGMNVMRLNFSHGDYEEHGGRIITARKLSKELNKNIAILLDTKGPEIRTGDFVGGKTEFKKGQVVTICQEDIEGTSERFTITYKELYRDVKPGGFILVNDGQVELLVDHVEGTDIVCVCANNGIVKNKRGINVPGIKLGFDYLSAKDIDDLTFGCGQPFNYVAASFVRRAQDVFDVKKLLIENGLQSTLILFFLTLIFGLILGMIIAKGRMSKLLIIQMPIRFFLLIMRGTPLILQLYGFYFGLYYIAGLSLDRMTAAVIGFSLNYAAYFAEIYRSGIQAIPKGQYEAAKVLGFNRSQTFFKIILPQVVKIITPSLGSECMTLVKDTSLAHVIGVMEIYVVATNQMARSRGMIYLVVAGIFYLIMNAIVSKVFSVIEKRMNYYR